MREIEKMVSGGKIRGLSMEDGTVQFRGIRYATAKRWCYPQPVEKWSGVYDATKFGAACVQGRTFRPEKEQKPEPFYYREFRRGLDFTYSEDCLFLNIYAPEEAKKAPVLLFIHGGAFMGGCGNELHMDGTAYARRNFVFVSINYRLGPLGFLADRQLAEEAGHTGNYGLYDQLEAIRWVYDHIADFGGDPENITLFGQSAGAMSIQQHVLSPLTKPYFHAVYMASGGGISRELTDVTPVEDSYEYCARLTSLLGRSPQEWRKHPVKDVFAALERVADSELLSHYCPHVDGRLIPKTPSEALKEGAAKDVPYLLSTNSEDMAPEILAPMAKNWCEAMNDRNRNRAYYFQFSRHMPGDDSGAFHSAELWYTMGTLEKCWRPLTDWDYSLQEALLACLGSFMKTGTPQSPLVPEWKPYTRMSRDRLEFGDRAISQIRD